MSNTKHFLKLSRIKQIQSTSIKSTDTVLGKMIKLKTTDLVDPRVRKLGDKLLYSDYIERQSLKFGYVKNYKILQHLKQSYKKINEETTDEKGSIAANYMDTEESQNSLSETSDFECNEEDAEDVKPIHMPYSVVDKYQNDTTKTFKNLSEEEEKNALSTLNSKYKNLYEKYVKLTDSSKPKNFNLRLGDEVSEAPKTWMTDYEFFDDALQNVVNYGTPIPNSKVSCVPCGGCGALLHCKDFSIPGYLPSEIFENKTDSELKTITCQRCHFMKNYNTCLDVRVSADDYPNLLKQIREDKKAIVLLLVDLTDFPCSIWPNLPAIIGENRNIFVLGNKIDLLPQDSPYFLDHVKDCLTESLNESGITKGKIKHISLISAKTGYGVDELINKLHKIWECRSNAFLIGCTNTGKSTLFNTLLNSDFCKSQAADLIQRATVSLWPGTTINLLKFPILKPNGSKLAMRANLLQKIKLQENMKTRSRLKQWQLTKDIRLATLQSEVVQIYKKSRDLSLMLTKLQKRNGMPELITPQTFGIDDKDSDFIDSKWCYDTPGVVQPDQILHLLTTDELTKTIPSRIISPRTFCLWPQQTIFIAGLGRLDILDAPTFIRCTVFAHHKLPVTICRVNDAELIYDELLQTKAFVVPINDPNRLKMWPKLDSKELKTVGIGKKYSASDVVLSSAGWIAIAAMENDTVAMRAWTPEGRGIYLRTPALLPKSVTLRGMRRIGKPAYQLGRQVYCNLK